MASTFSLFSSSGEGGLRGRSRSSENRVLVALLIYAALASGYFVARPWGLWSENDTAQLTAGIQAVIDGERLLPIERSYYRQGYAYSVVSSAVVAYTGLDATALTQVVYPLTAALLIVPAWLLYRELTGSRRAATLAALLLFMQSEFLFVVLRGSHERMLRFLIIVALWLLARGFRSREHPGRFAGYAILLYLITFAIISTNVFFGMSFAFAIGAAMVVAWVVPQIRPRTLASSIEVARRLTWVTCAAAVIGFLILFYVYPPAGQGLNILDSVGKKSTEILLTTQADAAPYQQAIAGWTSPTVYVLLSMGNFLLIALSAPIWLGQGVLWVILGRRPPSSAAWLLWLLYGAFVLQGALAVASDQSGQFGGNWQHRSFPSFAMVAVPTIAVGLCRLRLSRIPLVLASLLLALIAGMALLKATNEPILSNKWMFYTPAESRALVWVDHHQQFEPIWLGFDERLGSVFDLVVGVSQNSNWWVAFDLTKNGRTYVISDVVRAHAARVGQPVPAVVAENRVYDNGTTQVYRLRSRSPYQR